MTGLGDYPKSIRAEFRDLVGKAHERELGQALEALEAHFERWHEGEISPWDLNELIHQHHHGPSREIYNRYGDSTPADLVCYAIHRGLLQPEELSPAMTEIIAPRLSASAARAAYADDDDVEEWSDV